MPNQPVNRFYCKCKKEVDVMPDRHIQGLWVGCSDCGMYNSSHNEEQLAYSWVRNGGKVVRGDSCPIQ